MKNTNFLKFWQGFLKATEAQIIQNKKVGLSIDKLLLD